MHKQQFGMDREFLEIAEEALAYVSGGAGPEMDPNGGTDASSSIDPNG